MIDIVKQSRMSLKLGSIMPRITLRTNLYMVVALNIVIVLQVEKE